MAQLRPTNEQDLYFSWRLLIEARSEERGRELRANAGSGQAAETLSAVNPALELYAYQVMKKMLLRSFTVGAAMAVLSATAQSGPRVDVWVLLTEPPTASGAGNQDAIKKQQQAVMGRLHSLGALELGRVSVTRNAIAVSIEEAKLPEVMQLAGVRSVSPVRNIERAPPVAPTR